VNWPDALLTAVCVVAGIGLLTVLLYLAVFAWFMKRK
jgi:hypothetical protein